jgi:hypothetical protein
LSVAHERDDNLPRPDVEIGARVKAKRLRFESKPDVEVEFPGRPEVDSDTTTDRTNLPHEVEPGVTYRDVEVNWRAGARVVEPGEDPPREKPRAG